MESKTVKESRTEQVHILTEADMNGYSRLFGGTLMSWIDVLAAVVARRHSGRNVTTACVDSLEFRAPAFSNDTIFMTGKITCVGKTSMEVMVKTYVEALGGMRQLINKAYLVLVAIDSDGNPVAVPPIFPETDEEKLEFKAGIRRRELRKARKTEKY